MPCDGLYFRTTGAWLWNSSLVLEHVFISEETKPRIYNWLTRVEEYLSLWEKMRRRLQILQHDALKNSFSPGIPSRNLTENHYELWITFCWLRRPSIFRFISYIFPIFFWYNYLFCLYIILNPKDSRWLSRKKSNGTNLKHSLVQSFELHIYNVKTIYAPKHIYFMLLRIKLLL